MHSPSHSCGAIVEKMLGGSRCHITLPDQSTKLAIIRGKLRRRKTWINSGDLVLVGIRDFQDDKCDIIHKYTTGQVQMLKKKNALADGFLSRVKKTDQVDSDMPNDELNIQFQDDSDSEIELNKDNGNNGNKNDSSNIKEDKPINDSDIYEFDFDEI